MKRNVTSIIAILCSLFLLLQTSQVVYGQITYSKFAKNPDASEIKKLAAAVHSNPDNLKAHEDFIDAFDIKDPRLSRQYAVWMKRFPKSAMVPFALGKEYYDFTDSICKKYLIKAVNINPHMAQAWEYLSLYATFSGDHLLAIDYMRRATECDPKNADCAFAYAFLFKDGDPAKYDSLMLKVAYHFPDDIKGVKALYYLASYPFNSNERTTYYEALYRMGSKNQSAWFRAGMADYYAYLLNTSPDRAFDLSLRMVLEVKVNRNIWKQHFIDARNFVEARKLLDANEPDEAAIMLSHVNLGIYKTMGVEVEADTKETLALFKAEANNKGNKTQAAYDSLAQYYRKLPSDRLRNILINYASKLGLDSNRVDADIAKIRNDSAWNKTDFTLENYADHKPVSLSDFNGKVVLLTYWFPSCFPCRQEFPRVESVLKKFNSKDVAYLAINANNEQEEVIMPFIKSNNYTFIPLRDNPGKPIGNLPNVHSMPANFLIDQTGRVVFS
ncbi:MAG: redoxin domain-containing protein, partial [Mucilaginibacter sp.]